MKPKIKFWNRFDIAFLSLAAAGSLAFQAYVHTDRYRARELVDECGRQNEAVNGSEKPCLLATLGLASKPPREDRQVVIDDLKAVAEEAAPLLARRLGNDPGQVPGGGTYTRALANLGGPARPYLVAALNSPDRRVRQRAAYALGGLGQDALPIAPEMLQALYDEDGVVRQSMARSLVRIDREVAAREALPVILSDLRDGDLGVVFYATISLAELGPVDDASRSAIAEAEKGRFAGAFASMAKDRDRL
jgi:hypothetical protein